MHADAFAGVWEATLRQPLQELVDRRKRRTAVTALPSMNSSIVFGGMQPTHVSSSATPGQRETNSGSGAADAFPGLGTEVVLPVLDLVIEGLRCCPFLERLPLLKFVDAFLDLGAAGSHFAKQAASLALSRAERHDLLSRCP